MIAKRKSGKPFLALACSCLNVLLLNVLLLNMLLRLFGACPSEKRRSSGHLVR